MVNPNSLSTRVAVLGKHAVEAGEAVWPALPHDVPLSPEVSVALETREVLHVPSPALGLRALVRENYLKQNINLEKLPSATPLLRVRTLLENDV